MQISLQMQKHTLCCSCFPTRKGRKRQYFGRFLLDLFILCMMFSVKMGWKSGLSCARGCVGVRVVRKRPEIIKCIMRQFGGFYPKSCMTSYTFIPYHSWNVDFFVCLAQKVRNLSLWTGNRGTSRSPGYPVRATCGCEENWGETSKSIAAREKGLVWAQQQKRQHR